MLVTSPCSLKCTSWLNPGARAGGTQPYGTSSRGAGPVMALSSTLSSLRWDLVVIFCAQSTPWQHCRVLFGDRGELKTGSSLSALLWPQIAQHHLAGQERGAAALLYVLCPALDMGSGWTCPWDILQLFITIFIPLILLSTNHSFVAGTLECLIKNPCLFLVCVRENMSFKWPLAISILAENSAQ